MTTLVGLELTGRRVLVVGGGRVGLRRARRLLDDGARVVLVDPSPSDDARRTATHDDLTLVERRVEVQDVEACWLVVAATSDPAVNAQVTTWAVERRTWCVNASDGVHGTARMAAASTHGDLLIGVVSTGDPDPQRVVAVRDELALHVASGAVDLRRRRRGPEVGVDVVLAPGVRQPGSPEAPPPGSGEAPPPGSPEAPPPGSPEALPP